MPYLPDFWMTPDNDLEIGPYTPVSHGVKLSRFAKSVDLNSMTLADKKQICRNLLPNAEIVRHIGLDTELFRNCSLEVVEGIYAAGPTETITPNSLNDLKSKGRAIAYRVNWSGRPSVEKTYEFASWVNTYVKHFGKLYLDYDQYDPDGTLSCQVIIEMPHMPEDYNPQFNREIVTTFNNSIQSSSELIQFSLDDVPNVTLDVDDTSTVAKGFFCIGDSHAARAARATGAPWGAFAREGLSSRDSSNLVAVNRLTRGSTVCVSLGETDITNSTLSVSVVVDAIMDILVETVVLGHETSFMLLPIGNTANEERRKEFRSAMQGAIGSSSSFISIIDLGQSEFTLSRDGRHVTESSYIDALRRLE